MIGFYPLINVFIVYCGNHISIPHTQVCADTANMSDLESLPHLNFLSALCRFLPGRMYGADDFLPMLTYVLAQCDMPQLDTEIQYMMELLDPSLLQGEGRSCQNAEFKGTNVRCERFESVKASNICFQVRGNLWSWWSSHITLLSVMRVSN